MIKMNIKKDDVVVVLSGKDKGKQGKVLEVMPKERKVVVEKINMMYPLNFAPSSIKSCTKFHRILHQDLPYFRPLLTNAFLCCIFVVCQT